jgi:mono/diheme cytochrome c family protein
VLLALSTGQKIGLAAVAAVFVSFSLLSALVVPRWRPDFPGRAMRLYVPAVLVLFVGMMTAVFIFGKEKEEKKGAERETTTQTQTTQSTSAQGNAAAGKPVFASAGCASCHTFKEAGATGTVGPNLDEALKGKDEAFIRQSILDPNAVIAKGYPASVMPPNFGQQLSTKQLADVVAFLAQSTR